MTASQPPALVVRASREADIPAITAIYAPAVLTGTASFEYDPPDEAEMARRRAAILADGFPYLVAEKDGAILGYAYAGKYRPRHAYRFTVEDSIYIAPEAQGLGVGRALLARLIAECGTLGLRQMIAVIGDTASAGSIALHASLGFVHAGRMEKIGWKFGRWVDQVLMQRPLGPGHSEPPAGA